MRGETGKRLPALFWGRRRALLIRLVSLGVAQAVLAITVAYVTQEIFRSITPQLDDTQKALSEAFWGMLASLGAAVAVGFAFRVLEYREAERLAENYVTRVRLRLFDALTSAPVLTTRQSSLGPTLLRFVTDLSAVRQWVSLGLSRLIVSAFAVLGGAGAFFFIDPLIGAGFIVILFCVGALGIALGSELVRRVRHVRQQRSRLAARVADRLKALAAVQTAGRVSEEKREIKRRSRNLGQAAVRRATFAGLMRTLPDVGLGFMTVLILLVGGEHVARGEHSFGSIFAAIAVLGVIGPDVRALGRIYEYWKNYRVAVAKLDEVFSQRKKSFNRRKTVHGIVGSGELVFDNVTVKSSISGISGHVPPGHVVALVGASGCGKSALLGTAARLLKLKVGCVEIDGHDVGTLTDKEFAAEVGILSPELPLLRGTLIYNLTYRSKGVSLSEVRRVVQLCELGEEIEKLPGGLKTRLSEDDARFPDGLRQRILLARALMGGPNVLLLDEPDTRLDPTGRRVVDRILAQRTSTVLIVTNEMARISRADAIWFLESGELVEVVAVPEGLTGDTKVGRFLRAGIDDEALSNVIKPDFLNKGPTPS